MVVSPSFDAGFFAIDKNIATRNQGIILQIIRTFKTEIKGAIEAGLEHK